MADVDIIPKIRCDNCGYIAEKTARGTGKLLNYTKPSLWGKVSASGGRATDSYGGVASIAFVDLCPACAVETIDAIAAALKIRRGE